MSGFSGADPEVELVHLLSGSRGWERIQRLGWRWNSHHVTGDPPIFLPFPLRAKRKNYSEKSRSRPRPRADPRPGPRGAGAGPDCQLSPVLATEFHRCSMAAGCLCCLKYLMFVFNLVFWLCGCGLLGVGIWLSATQGNFATLAPRLPALSAANLVIATGTIVMVVGFLGCLGAIKENKCLLLSFFIILLTIFLMELILVILFFVYRTEVADYAREDLKAGLEMYGTEGNIGLTNAWNIIQTEYTCCGVDNSTDWNRVMGDNFVPDSCCQEYSQKCGQHDPSKWFSKGCYDKIKAFIEQQTVVLGSVAMTIVVIQILGMAFSMTLFHQISKGGKKYKV